MRKSLLFVFVLLFATAAMAQNRAVLLQESFDGATMPAGWSAQDHASNWSISTTQNAGGAPNELKLFYNPQFNGTTHFMSPAVDLTGINSVVFSFKHCLDNYSGSHTLGIARVRGSSSRPRLPSRRDCADHPEYTVPSNEGLC